MAELNLLRGPKMVPVFPSKRRALAYAQRKANETDHLMSVERLSARRWKVIDRGELPPLPEQESHGDA